MHSHRYCNAEHLYVVTTLTVTTTALVELIVSPHVLILNINTIAPCYFGPYIRITYAPYYITYIAIIQIFID